ncbi:hypothetical protein NQ166_01020 [Microbacterium sp. zg.Y1090]|uniref:hypothetical protein n=1 Tax=Microbacterium wangruii TaxID=3049073 RepID=UPI00214C2A2E|nr:MULTISPECIES: hypothetical protein [unclassified Microbacterium]MCR2817409.1 hypothetical protein [Microbacterium sp. zg.Y1090]WIM29105.1 hypothetical protein QNO26_04190 [Microbacterium sp. zg-Y1090]
MLPNYLPRPPRGDRPLVVLGISDVVVIEGSASVPVTTHRVSAWGRWVRDVAIPDDAAARIARLADRYEVVWASEWGHNAHTAFAAALQLPDEPWPFLPVQFDKIDRIRAYAKGLPWAWIDGPVVDLHATDGVDDGIVIRVDPASGISGVDLEALDAQLAELAR